jgi:CDP-diacylglycerol---serine O-phosphatidyltransferase
MTERDKKSLRSVPHNDANRDPGDSETAYAGADAETVSGEALADGSVDADPEEDQPETHEPEEEVLLTRRARFRRRGIYLLPNLITTGALFSGFYAIVAGMNGNFVAASLAMFVAMALDTADGRVARLTNTESAFGAEYDSLSDMVAFGVAPALVAFSWGLSTLGQFGWVATFVYMACAALRLARFNTKGDNASFTGLASPSAAAIVACCIWVWVTYVGGEPSAGAAVAMAIITAVTGLLMVSHFKYFSPKLINFKGRVPFVTLVFIVLGFSVLMVDPPTVLLVLFTAYALSGPVQHLWRRTRKRN